MKDSYKAVGADLSENIRASVTRYEDEDRIVINVADTSSGAVIVMDGSAVYNLYCLYERILNNE